MTDDRRQDERAAQTRDGDAGDSHALYRDLIRHTLGDRGYSRVVFYREKTGPLE